MKTVRDVIRRAPIWVNPEHTVESAIVLMRGHCIGGLPVLEGRRLVGFVFYAHLLGAPPEQIVRNLMLVGIPVITPGFSIRAAAALMTSVGMSRLPVVENEELIGVLTDGDLLPELGRSFDPLTELPWSDSLREWAIDHLRNGTEIAIIFVDLDHFGQFNKRFGHIIGDEVLQAVARTLRAQIDPAQDLLCRYGGDEFCIASIRTAEDALLLKECIPLKISEIKIPSLHEERISCSVGMRGGKRSREREKTHYSATLNNLINLASRDCIENKKRALPVTGLNALREPAAPAQLVLADVEVQNSHHTYRVQVEIHAAWPETDQKPGQGRLYFDGLNRYTASTMVQTDDEGLLRTIADTAICAVNSYLPDAYDLALTDVAITLDTSGQMLITTIGRIVIENRAIPIAGSALASGDMYHAAAASALAAVNRFLTRLQMKTIYTAPENKSGNKAEPVA
jgi:IMP dehydrogenase